MSEYDSAGALGGFQLIALLALSRGGKGEHDRNDLTAQFDGYMIVSRPGNR